MGFLRIELQIAVKYGSIQGRFEARAVIESRAAALDRSRGTTDGSKYVGRRNQEAMQSRPSRRAGHRVVRVDSA